MGERHLFRWVGGKRYAVDAIAPVIRAHLDARGGRLISCFFGSGAIERAVGGRQIAADAAPELLQLYDDLQRHGPDAVFRALRRLDARTDRTKVAYKELRAIRSLPGPQRSARFLWLSAMSRSGIWRVNRLGTMNVPPDPDRLASRTSLPPLAAVRAFAQQIRETVFVNGWRRAWAKRRREDLILADPPYMGLGVFREYTNKGFNLVDQQLLARCLREHVENGGAVIAFNGPAAAQLYKGWARVVPSMRPGTISSKLEARGEVAELLITAGLRAYARAA